MNAPSNLYSDDVSLVVVLVDANPFFLAAAAAAASSPPSAASLPFSDFLKHVIPFLNSLLLHHQHNHIVLIATGVNSCGYIYDSAAGDGPDSGDLNAVRSQILRKLEELVAKDWRLAKKARDDVVAGSVSSLLSGSLSLALCCIISFHNFPFGLKVASFGLHLESLTFRTDIQRIFRSGARHPQPRVPIDSCIVGPQHSAFLQQASYITGGVYLKPQQLDGLFEYLAAVFETDLQSRNYLQLPKPSGVDFRASSSYAHHGWRGMRAAPQRRHDGRRCPSCQ